MPARPSRRAAAAIGSTPRVGVNRSVERQLAEQHEIGDVPALDDALAARMPSAIGRSNAAPALRTSAGARLTVIAVRRELEAGVADGAPHAVAALAHARVRQADHRERREAERHVHFDVDRTGLDAEDGGRPQAGEHAGRRCKRRRQIASRRVFKELSGDRRERDRRILRAGRQRCGPVDCRRAARRRSATRSVSRSRARIDGQALAGGDAGRRGCRFQVLSDATVVLNMRAIEAKRVALLDLVDRPSRGWN